MRSLFFSLLLAAPLFLPGQTFQLAVINGYGGGTFSEGDTVHVWAAEWANNEVFGGWTGQTASLKDAGEWHTTLVMPAQNVVIEAHTKTLPPGADFTLENIQGRDTLKRVYRYFPPGGPPKGVVWLFHGTGGSANAWVNEFENRQFSNLLMADTFAVVVTECEETTKNADLNNDGNFRRWFYAPFDTNANVDVANVRAIRDTFINRGWITASTPQLATGFSAGGAFSIFLGPILQWDRAVSYCSAGPAFAPDTSHTPTQFCMARRDDHPEVGPLGNLEALENHQRFLERGVCSRFFLLEPSPVYPQRFRRMPGITALQSLAVFNDLQNNDALDAENYLIISPFNIEQSVMNAPQNWPGIVALTVPQRGFIRNQLNAMWPSHTFYSDFNAKTLRFLRQACGTAAASPEPPSPGRIHVYPNPAADRVFLPGNTGPVRVYDATGRPVFTGSGGEVQVEGLTPGLYRIHTLQGWGTFVRL
jgi:hypothetical protein